MQDKTDVVKINHFLFMVTPLVSQMTKTSILSFGCKVKQRGSGLGIVFDIESGSKTVEFYLHNLLLEIATIDRDENPPRFDHNLNNVEFFLKKTLRLLESKLKILQPLLSKDNIDTSIERITNQAKHYQRIRILKLDQHKSP